MKNFLVILFLIAASVALLGGVMTWMPGEPLRSALPAANEAELECVEALHAHVDALALDIGVRDAHAPEKLADAELYLSNQLARAGLSVTTINYEARSKLAHDVVADIDGGRGRDEVILVGAHFDSPARSPGAEDNASGCAVLLEIARALGRNRYDRTIRFVLFSNGARPNAGGAGTGSLAYAQQARDKKEKIQLMLSLDSLGIYRDTPGSQSCPFPLSTRYPDRGDFVAFIGALGARGHVARCVEMFRAQKRFPCEGLALPAWVPGFDESDDAAFRALGFPAVLVTDTGVLRYEQSGKMSDTADRLDYGRMARVTVALTRLVAELAQKKTDLAH